MASWNPLRKSSLTHKPDPAPGIIDRVVDKELEDLYVKLQKLEDANKRILKEIKKLTDGVQNLSKAENKLVNDLSSSAACQKNEKFRGVVEEYATVTTEMSKTVQETGKVYQKTVVDPMKKYNGEFSNVSSFIHKRDTSIADARKLENKIKKLQDKEKSTANIAKQQMLKKSLEQAIVEAQTTHKRLLAELHTFHELRGQYLTPSLQSIIQNQTEYYGTSLRLFTHLANMSADGGTLVKTPQKMSEKKSEIDRKLNAIRSLAIVGGPGALALGSSGMSGSSSSS
ncbi:bridging integrator 3-like [Neocloeon triangulifer]|uniref:bridging integrator 3-like n=1 Tax=Neocloeon triangulifer TaxID=2078957 RepID=UPI00286F913F|nr:bridging integrator 3-like [Neocloeon triangulifer]